MLKRRAPLARRARARWGRGDARAMGRPAASMSEWKLIRQTVLARAGWRCQACGVRRRLDVHHVVKRSQGGSDFDLEHFDLEHLVASAAGATTRRTRRMSGDGSW